MRLASYLEQQRITHGEFARLVGASPWGVGKWVRGERVPRQEVMQRIREATAGAVTANDFLAPASDRLPAQPEVSA